ncbi:MAG: hypothetical protein P1U64_14490 [Alcanivoracaceae bacterium]|jgi:hypothetical protein|nr:hypothetical protein [Alcanivoracaceae bacterium]
MSFETVPLVIIIICVLLVIGGAAILLRQKWLVQWFKGTAGLLLVGLAVYFSLFALNLFSYNELREGSPIATVSFRQMGPQQYMATVSEPDGSNVDYPLSGDLWQIDARIVRWKGLFALFGFSPGYQLDRIQGRYLTLEDERSKERTVYEVIKPGIGIDIWHNAREGWSMLVDARYGSATYLPMADSAIFEVVLTPSGLVGRPLNGSAEQAVGRWE